jgi:two-component system, cell cycle sensor histidine kinase and response regulator CckA
MAAPPRSTFDDPRLGLLEQISRRLKEAETSDRVLQVGVQAVVPEFADLAVVLSDQDGLELLEVAHADVAQEPKVRSLVESHVAAIRAAAQRATTQSRHFRWVPHLNRTSLRFLRSQPELAELLLTLHIRSLIVVPIGAAGQVFGGMACCRTREGAFTASDLALAQVVARRIATLVQTARMYEQVTDERSRRAKLEAAVQKWVRVFDLAGWGAAIVDGSDHRLEAVNPAFASLHGYADPTALIGQLYTALLLPDHWHQLNDWATHAATVRPYESTHVRQDGTVFPVLTDVTALPMTEGSTSYVVTVQDVSELKRSEERLRRAQRLEAVGRLAGGVAHEVNNMMTIILGFSDLLARRREVSAEGDREIEEIRKAATRAGKITQQLLAFSRQQILQPAYLKINEVVSDLVPVLRLLLPANIELGSALAPISPSVLADRAQLDQVIINLVFNARDAMTGGGTLRLVTDSRRLHEEEGRRLIGIPIPTGQYALISVIDTGHGMDSATLQQVFEPFFTTKPVGSGTGLGLATVYGIVKQSGGYVWVESSPGQGTTVTVCLPQPEQRAPLAIAAPVDQTADCRPGRVLLIEDEEGVRELARRVLAGQGHRIVDARDGDEALAKLREFGPELDLVVSDVIIPGIGTRELDEELRRARPDLPVLYMSGYSRDDVTERGLIDPERLFLQKPFTAEELTALVCRQLAGTTGAGGDQVTS